MRYSIELGPRAAQDPLACEIERRIRANLDRGVGVRSFTSMWGTLVLVCKDDAKDAATGAATDRRVAYGVRPPRSTLTLRFDYGHLSIHEGRVGRPDVTLWGTSEEILGLGAARSDRGASSDASASFLRRARAFRNVLRPGALRIFGRATRPRLALRFAMLIAPQPEVR